MAKLAMTPERAARLTCESGSLLELICPYCGRRAVLCMTSRHLFNGIDYGPVWECSPCGARVGCHRGSTTPFGTLANAAAREMRKQAHAELDPIWKMGFMDRSTVYNRIANMLGWDYEIVHELHIGNCDEHEAKAVRDAARVLKEECIRKHERRHKARIKTALGLRGGTNAKQYPGETSWRDRWRLNRDPRKTPNPLQEGD